MHAGTIGMIILCASAAGQLLPIPEQEDGGVGYKTVDEAMAALRAKEGVEIRIQQGWTIATDRAANTIWSFSPREYPAHPAVVKRALVERNGQIFVNMSVLCQAPKIPCDNLVHDFQLMNSKLADEMQHRPKP